MSRAGALDSRYLPGYWAEKSQYQLMWCFRIGISQDPGKRGHIVADTHFVSGTQKMFLILFRNILCPQQMFPSLRSPRNIMGNSVSATMCPRLPGPLGVKKYFKCKSRPQNSILVAVRCSFQNFWKASLCFYLGDLSPPLPPKGKRATQLR